MQTDRGVARIFEWGTSAEGARSEAPKVPRGIGCGEGCPPPAGEGKFDYLTLKWCILVRI